MANPLDLILGGRGRLERLDDEDEGMRGTLDSFAAQLPVVLENPTEEQADQYQQAGYMQNAQGDIVTPERQRAMLRDRRIQDLQNRAQAERDRKLKNPFFVVGDSLADIGRTFLSPLFWLSGQDSSALDPSERVKTQYRGQFQQLEELRYANMQNLLTARDNRAQNYRTMLKDFRSIREPYSSGEKELYDFAVRTGRLDEYLNPNTQQNIRNEFRASKGDIVGLRNSDGTSRFMPTKTYETISQYGKDFQRVTSGFAEAYSGYARLVEALNSGTGVGDVATIFGFVRTLDPTSVVKEGEYNLAANAGGLWDQLTNIITKYKTGQALPPAVRQDIADLSRALMNSYIDEYDRVRGNYTRRIEQLDGTTTEDILTQLGTPIELVSQKSVSSAGGSPSAPAAPITVENAPMPNDPAPRRIRPTGVPAPTDLNTAGSPEFLEAFDRYGR